MNFKIVGLATVALLTSATVVLADMEITPEIKQKIEDTLTTQGHEVGKMKVEDGLYEVYAKKGDQKVELFLNEKLEVVKTEND